MRINSEFLPRQYCSLSKFYTNTEEEICVNDQVYIDDIGKAVVKNILRPRTHDTIGYSCFNTGGIVVEAEGYGKMLFAFGEQCKISKIDPDIQA